MMTYIGTHSKNYLEVEMNKVITIITLFICMSICVCDTSHGNCENMTEIEQILIWTRLRSRFQMVINTDNKTISLCSTSSDCHCYNNILENSSFQQIKPLVLPQGISLNITVQGSESLQFYKATNLAQFQSCTINNETFTVNSSTNEIQGQLLNLGSHLFICNGQDTSEQFCQNGCRWNITIKENRCKTNDTDNICNGNGKCTSLDNEDQFSCKCFDGFGGSVCEINYAKGDNLSVCTDSNCRNGGTCVTEESVISSTNISSPSCLCPSHFTGQYCETILNNCKSSPCVNGVCVEHIDGYQCYCVPGFHGKNCELEYNECLSNPCFNRGTCIDRVDKFECRCSVGFQGDTCQDKVNFCQPNPCHKNSTCTSNYETFACICHHGFTGKFCDERIKSCSSNPCKNHGTCIEYETGYQCMCQVTFAGQHCEYMMDVFAPPMEGADLSGESHKHNMYIVAGTLGSMVLIVVSVIVACYCKVYETYKQLMWKRLRYHRKRSNSCPDLETCNEPNYIGKHRLSADAIWEATSLCHENAAFENSTNHQTFTSMQI